MLGSGGKVVTAKRTHKGHAPQPRTPEGGCIAWGRLDAQGSAFAYAGGQSLD